MKKESILILVALSITTLGFSQFSFSGIFNETAEQNFQYLENGSWEELQFNHASNQEKGLQLIDLETTIHENQRTYWAIWQTAPEESIFESVNGWTAMVQQKRQKAKDGYLMTDIESYVNADGEAQYLVSWKKKEQYHKMWKLESWDGVLLKLAAMQKQGLYLVDLEAIKQPDQSFQYLCVFHKNLNDRRSYAVYHKDFNSFAHDKSDRNKSGYYLTDFEAVAIDGETHLFGIYLDGNQEDGLRYQLDKTSLQAYGNYLGENFHLTDIEIQKGDGRMVAPPILVDRLITTPDFYIYQDKSTVKVPLENKVYLDAPAAAANSLAWLALNGYPELYQAKKDPEGNQLIYTLGDEEHMKSITQKGVEAEALVDGLVKYIAGKGYSIQQLQYHGVHPFMRDKLQMKEAHDNIELEDELSAPELNVAKSGLIDKSIALIQVGLYTQVPNSKDLERVEQRWFTLVGYGQNPFEVKDPNVLIVHDPTDDYGKIRQYLEVDPLYKHTDLNNDSRLIMSTSEASGWQETRPAKSGQYLKNMESEDEGARKFAVWEGVVSLQLQKPKS